MLLSQLPAIALSLASLTLAVPYPSSVLEARNAVGEDTLARRYGGLDAVDRIALLARGFADVEQLDSLLKRASKSCSKTIQCRGQPLPDNAHQFCHDGSCTFGCNKGYKTDSTGSGCVALTAVTTSQTTTSSTPLPTSAFTCQQTTDCSIALPDNSHQRCQSNVCVIGCNRGYKLDASSATCMSVSQTTTGKPYTSTSAAVVVVVPTSSASSASSASSSASASPPAATTTSAPPSTKTYSGQGTYFYQNGQYGACGNKFPDSALLVAMDTRMYGDENAVSKYCGRTVIITNTANGKMVTATVQDACPTCESSGSLDLSVAAFKKIGLLDTGVLPITWVFA